LAVGKASGVPGGTRRDPEVFPAGAAEPRPLAPRRVRSPASPPSGLPSRQATGAARSAV